MTVRLEFLNLTHSTAHALAEITEAAAKLDPLAVAIDEYDEANKLWSVSAYFDQTPDTADINTLAEIAADALELAPLKWHIKDVPDINWVQKSLEGLNPVPIGRFFVHGAHDQHLRPPHSIAIELEASMAFGSGHHGTTKGCLLAYHEMLKTRRFARILDVGTGTGILAIAAAKAQKTTVIASDIDPVSVEYAAMNAHLNGVGNFVKCVECTGLNHPAITQNGPYDLIFANILARPLAKMALSMGAATAVGGTVILSGILPQQALSVESAYRAQGFVVTKRYELENWTTLCLHV